MTATHLPASAIDIPRIDYAACLLRRPPSPAVTAKTSTNATRYSRKQRAVITTVAVLALNASTAIAEQTQRLEALSRQPSRFAVYVEEAAHRFALPAAWIWAVMRIESAGKPQAVSPKGARGLMQIMPRTWEGLRARYALGADPFDAHDNIIAGAAYLRELRDRYGAPGFLAAYNAGPRLYEDHMMGVRTLPLETTGYVAAALRLLNSGFVFGGQSSTTSVQLWTEGALFPLSGGTVGATHAGTQNLPVPAPKRRNFAPPPSLTPHSDGLFASADIQPVRP